MGAGWYTWGWPPNPPEEWARLEAPGPWEGVVRESERRFVDASLDIRWPPPLSTTTRPAAPSSGGAYPQAKPSR